MHYQAQRIILAALPLALAAMVAASLPVSGAWLSAASAPTPAVASLQRYADCRRSHPVQPQPATSAAGQGRTQSPEWLRAHAAAIERCLRDGAALG